MRPFAIAVALLLLPFASPALAVEEHDECKDAFARNPCVEILTPSPHPAAPAKQYYLYLGWTKCPPQNSPHCMGTPNDNHELPFKPLFGTLYEDTNKYPGLQRHALRLSDTLVIAPDRILLV